MTNFVDVFGGQVTPPSEYGYQATTISSNTTAYWPYNYAGTGLVLAKNNDITASAASLAITLPDATEVSTGEDFIVKNAGSNSFEVKDNAGNTLTTITAGVAKYFVLTNNNTAAGVYDITTFGTGTSSADAGILAGAGHRVDGDAIDNIVENNSIGASYVISASDNATTLVYKSGTATLALPSPSSLYNGYFFIFINEGSGTVTLDPSASVTIDGSLTKDLQPGESCIVTTDGVLYYTAGYGRSNTYVWTQLTVDLTGLSSYTVTPTQAQNKLWYFFNAPVSSMTVTIPSVASVYFLRVGAIGGYTLTFTTGSGATVGLTSNQSYIIYCDGTNITAAQTVAVTSTLSLVDGSAASPSLNFSLDTDTGIYRKNTNQLAIAAGGVQAAYFDVGGLYANVTGNLTGNATTATSATNATNTVNVGVTDDVATAATVYPTWVTATTGNLPEKVSSTKLTFNPSTGTLTATAFSGTFTGTADNSLRLGGVLAADYALLASPAFTGTPTAPTQTVGDSTTKLATTAFVTSTAFSTVLPGQAGNAGKFVTTDGANASWAPVSQVPPQATHNGEFLTTDGTTASWAAISLNTVTGYLDILGTSAAGANIKLYEDTDNGTNYVSLKAPDTIAANVTWQLPGADGTTGQVLATNGAGVLSFNTVTVPPVINATSYFLAQI
jgi:hypothetical protein